MAYWLVWCTQIKMIQVWISTQEYNRVLENEEETLTNAGVIPALDNHPAQGAIILWQKSLKNMIIAIVSFSQFNSKLVLFLEIVF